MISISKGDVKLSYNSFLFPGGEIGVKLDSDNLKYRYHLLDTPHTITAKINSSADFMELVMVTDALRRLYPGLINLFLPYVPYGRQDRVCCAGESFSLKAFANLINSLKYNKVITIDPHSHVTEAVFDNLEVITQKQLINRWQDFLARVTGTSNAIFVSPDAGANKKTAELAGYFNHPSFIRADKLRNLATGEIKETVVYSDDLTGMEVFVVDDVCDGGRTFIELAKVLKAKGAEKVILFVTHGIFSRGTKDITKSGIDEIWSTNSFHHVWPGGTGDVKTFDVGELVS